ncbi:hypothetical protein AN958_03436 [Leucoagaricus sp. SymC.cos]|nr:hypothetical protein AN958_03436 [Leucoagaricus sp. SymC.cos]
MSFRPGDPSLLTQILAAVRSAAHPSPPLLDPIVLQALLTCIVAKDAHLILRTHDEDVSAVLRLVVWILSSVFDYTTHKLKIRPKSQSPSRNDYFLRSLFLPASPSSPGSQDEGSDANKSRRVPSRRSRMLRASPVSPILMDPMSLSNVSPKSPIGHHVRPSAHLDTGPHHYSHSNITIHPGNSSPPQLPRAMVISGLENASSSSQRALAQVLADKRVSFDSPRDGRSQADNRQDTDGDDFNGTCALPDGFIVVYVCPIDPRERPNIHNSLLDKFAMSCNVLLKPQVRHALQPIPLPPAVARTNSGAHSNPSSPLMSSHVSLPPQHASTRPPLQPRGHSHSHSGSHLPTLSSPVLPRGLLDELRKVCAKTYLAPTLSLYLADLFSATRHYAQIDGTLLTVRCVHDAERLARAARVVGVDPTGFELLRSEDKEDAQDMTGDEDDEDSQWHDIEDEYETVGATLSLCKSSSSLKLREDTQPPTFPASTAPILDVTEVNIARIFPRCVSHRLRVRDGPREEVLAGAVFGATFGDTVAEETSAEELYVDAYEPRPTVKDILVSIMSEV